MTVAPSIQTEPELLELHETVSLCETDAPAREDGLVPLVIIRPGLGRGRGRHLYEADMLKREADNGRFTGWRMYVDHQSKDARQKAGGLPRSIRDLGGVISESWWDPDYSDPDDAKNGHGRGAVRGLARPTRFMRSLIEDIPEAVMASIRASATGVRPVQHSGERAWLVEGIQPRGSVDWVTEAGAGGKVISLMESVEESMTIEEGERELLEGLTDNDLLEHIRADRPDLYEAIIAEAAAKAKTSEDDPEDIKDGGSDELEELIQQYLPKFKGNRKMAEMAAKRHLAGPQETTEGGEVANASELLQEALASDEGKQAITIAVREAFAEVVAPALGEVVEAALADERSLLQAEANAGSRRMIQVRDLRDAAHQIIAESKLPEAFQSELRSRYDLRENEPTPSLDVVDDRDEATGEVTKTAEDKLREALAEDIEVKRNQVASVAPTTIRGQGPAKAAAAKSTEVEEGAETPKTTGSSATDELLVESRFSPEDLSEIYKGL